MPETRTFVIQEMARDHLPQVLAIERASYPAPWSETAFSNEMTSDVSVTIVAVTGQSVSGFLVGWIVADQVHVANIAVEAGHRRRGIGNGMMAWLLREAVRRECANCTLEVRESNQAARGMYRQLGFRSVALRRSYYSNPVEDAVVMVKSLRESNADFGAIERH